MPVYFISRIDNGHVKIGHSVNPEARLAALMGSWSTSSLRLLAQFPGGPAEENVLHERFKSSRLKGEWFRRSDELTHVIGVVSTFGSMDSFPWFAEGLAARW